MQDILVKVLVLKKPQMLALKKKKMYIYLSTNSMKLTEINFAYMVTIVSSGLIHIWCSADYLWQQRVVCQIDLK